LGGPGAGDSHRSSRRIARWAGTTEGKPRVAPTHFTNGSWLGPAWRARESRGSHLQGKAGGKPRGKPRVTPTHFTNGSGLGRSPTGRGDSQRFLLGIAWRAGTPEAVVRGESVALGPPAGYASETLACGCDGRRSGVRSTSVAGGCNASNSRPAGPESGAARCFCDANMTVCGAQASLLH